MTKEELKKQAKARLKLDPAVSRQPEANVDQALDAELALLSVKFQFEPRTVLWLERRAKLRLYTNRKMELAR